MKCCLIGIDIECECLFFRGVAGDKWDNSQNNEKKCNLYRVDRYKDEHNDRITW